MRNYQQLTKALRNLNYFEESEVFKEILSEIGFFWSDFTQKKYYFCRNKIRISSLSDPQFFVNV